MTQSSAPSPPPSPRRRAASLDGPDPIALWAASAREALAGLPAGTELSAAARIELARLRDGLDTLLGPSSRRAQGRGEAGGEDEAEGGSTEAGQILEVAPAAQEGIDDSISPSATPPAAVSHRDVTNESEPQDVSGPRDVTGEGDFEEEVDPLLSHPPVGDELDEAFARFVASGNETNLWAMGSRRERRQQHRASLNPLRRFLRF